MREYYSYVSRAGKLVVRPNDPHDIQDHLRYIKKYLGLFMTDSWERAKEIAGELFDEWKREKK